MSSLDLFLSTDLGNWGFTSPNSPRKVGDPNQSSVVSMDAWSGKASVCFFSDRSHSSPVFAHLPFPGVIKTSLSTNSLITTNLLKHKNFEINVGHIYILDAFLGCWVFNLTWTTLTLLDTERISKMRELSIKMYLLLLFRVINDIACNSFLAMYFELFNLPCFELITGIQIVGGGCYSLFHLNFVTPGQRNRSILCMWLPL